MNLRLFSSCINIRKKQKKQKKTEKNRKKQKKQKKTKKKVSADWWLAPEIQ